MGHMGFYKRWIDLIMLCVKTISYSILVNVEPKDLIYPTRGIRQGGLLSDFFFLLCTEGLHILIKRAANNGDIRGFSLCKRGLKLTHLFFIDDSLLFCRANIEECDNVLELLAQYEACSGQKKKKKIKLHSFSVNQLRRGIDRLLRECWGCE